MTQFHEGQEVEVLRSGWSDGKLKTHGRQWHKAKIMHEDEFYMPYKNRYVVAFPDGTRAVFDTDHIRRSPQEMAQAFYADMSNADWDK
jgi:hypothetical protein